MKCGAGNPRGDLLHPGGPGARGPAAESQRDRVLPQPCPIGAGSCSSIRVGEAEALGVSPWPVSRRPVGLLPWRVVAGRRDSLAREDAGTVPLRLVGGDLQVAAAGGTVGKLSRGPAPLTIPGLLPRCARMRCSKLDVMAKPWKCRMGWHAYPAPIGDELMEVMVAKASVAGKASVSRAQSSGRRWRDRGPSLHALPVVVELDDPGSIVTALRAPTVA